MLLKKYKWSAFEKCIHKSRRLLLTTFLISIVLLLNNCGYSIHRHAALPFSEISIGTIENKTVEPKLQDKLHKALVEEFIKQGISISPSSALKLSGTIYKFIMVSLSEKNGITVEYSVFINVDFKLADNKGGAKEIKNISSPFIVSFAGSEDFGGLLANKDIAEEKALNDVAMQIVGALIYK